MSEPGDRAGVEEQPEPLAWFDLRRQERVHDPDVENEEDTPTRLVYADWLDERGEHEEADRQRKWPAAKEWLVRFCRDHSGPEDNPDNQDLDDYGYLSSLRNISYETLLKLVRCAVVSRGDTCRIAFYSANHELVADLEADDRLFWMNWSPS
jgi:hypothetical protein